MTHDLTTGSDNTSDEGNETQPKLGPLPTRAYSKLLGIDPLSPPEEEATYSDDEFLTVMEAEPSKAPLESAHENTRFYGKSSFVVFTSQAFTERHKEAGIRDNPERRNEFWTIPDVSSAISHEYANAQLLSSGCPPYLPPLPYTSSIPIWTSCDTLWIVTSTTSTFSSLFSTGLPLCAP